MSRRAHHLDWSKKSEKGDGIVNIRKARNGVVEAEVGSGETEYVVVALGTSDQAVCALAESLHSMCRPGAGPGLTWTPTLLCVRSTRIPAKNVECRVQLPRPPRGVEKHGVRTVNWK